MNTYILIVRHLGAVSGEKIYHYNKLKYMVSLGWRVLYFSDKPENTPVDGEANFTSRSFHAIAYSPNCYSKNNIEKVLNEMEQLIGDTNGGRCIIEADSVNRAVWGELLAPRIGAKNMAFLLQESHNYDERTRRFLRFKYDRHELAGITKQVIFKILGDDTVKERDDTKIEPFCNNVVEDVEDVFSQQLLEDAACTFGSIGRLDKGCVLPAIEAFRACAAENPDKKYNLLLIGGATGRKRIGKIRRQVEECKNINLVITGYLYPIPKTLIEKVDVFVSTAGAVNASYRFHRPTVRVHPLTGEPVGIMGLDDLEGKTMYDIMPGTTVKECIERALSNAGDIYYKYNYYEDFYELMSKEFDRHLMIAERQPELEYYDAKELIKITPTHIKGRALHWLVGHIGGAGLLNRLVKLYKRLKGI